MAENDRVRNLHHRCFHVQREQRAVFLGFFDLLGQKFIQRLRRHERCVDHGARRESHAVFQHGLGPVSRNMNDSSGTGLGVGQCQGFLVGKEITAGHGGYFGFAVLGPCAHRMRVGHSVFLNRCRSAAVRVALAQHGVYSRSLDRVIGGAGLLFSVGAGGFGIVGQRVALGLQFLDGGNQLRNRSGDIGQLDHVGIRCFHQASHRGQII